MQFETLFNNCFGQSLSSLEFCCPAIIVGTQRLSEGLIDVQPLINKTVTTNDTIEYPTILDVPVITYSTYRSKITLPVFEGDTVLLIFCKSSISDFKLGLSEPHDAPDDSVLSLNSAVAFLGFNSIVDSPYNNSTYTNKLDFENLNIVHNADLENEVILSLTKEGDVRIKAGKVISEAVIETPEDVVIKGVSVYQFMQTHVHPYINVATPAVTSPPLPTPPTSYTTEITKE